MRLLGACKLRDPALRPPRRSENEDEQVRPLIWYLKLRKNWEEFRAVFTGPYDGINASCCKGYDASETRRRISASLLAMLCATLPCVLVKSKWLQTGPLR